MTISTSSYTTNSLRINIVNETSSTNIISSIQQGMYKGGWTQYDISTATVTAGALYSPITTLVYSAPNADGVTTKYMIIRIDTVKLVIYTSTCESWTIATKIANNESWTGGGTFPQHYDIKNSIILIAATQRHCVIWTFINNEPGIWSGVFEFERVAAEDVTTGTPVPCWAWTNSLMMGTPYGQTAIGQTSPIMFAFPRTADGATGANAARAYAPSTNRGMFPPAYLTAGVVISNDPNMLHLGSYAQSASSGTVTYGWDSFKSVVSPVSADGIYKYMPLGRAYNLGITKALGGPLDTVNVNIDSTGGWPSASGSNTETILLPLHGGTVAQMLAAATTGTTSFYASLPASTTATKVLSIGNNVWVSTNNGIYTFDQSLGQGSAVTQRVSHAVSGGVLDMVFDGARTVYGSLSNGIVAVDTETFTTTTNATISTGTSYLGIDGKYVYGSGRTAQTTMMAFAISRFNLATSSTYMALTSATVVATGFGTPVPDYQGNVYLASQAGGATPGTAAANTMFIAKFASDTGVGTQLYNPKFFNQPFGTGTAAPAPTDSPSSWYIDYTTTNSSAGPKPYLFVGGISTGPTAWVYEFNTGALTTSSMASWTPSTTGVVANASMGTSNGLYDYRGDLNIIPSRGHLFISPKKVGVAAPTGYVAAIVPNHPQGSQFAGQSLYLTQGTTGIPSVPYAISGGGQTITGNRIYGSHTQTANTDNRVYVWSGVTNPAYTSLGFAGTGKLVLKG